MNYLLGIDIGTAQSKAVLVDLAGNIVASGVTEHDTLEVQPGYYEHDAEQIWIHDCKKLIGILKEESGVSKEQIVAVCMSAIGPCVLPVSQEGRPLCPAILYGIDTRACQEIEDLNKKYGEDFFLRLGGNALSTQAAGPKIAWLRNNRPEIFEAARYFMTATTYLVYRFTGQVVMDYYTACAGYMPLFDYKNMQWDAQMCEEIGCAGRLPELKWTSDLAGVITEAAAEEFGLVAGTKVCTGTCDAAAEAVSVGVVDTNQTMLMLGSTAFMISVMDMPVTDPCLWTAPYLFPGTYALLGGMGSAGSLTKWFLGELSKETFREAECLGINPYALLAEKSADVPVGCEGLVALPYFCGERTPLNDPKAKGVFFGLSLRHTEQHLYRAILESVAFGIRDNLEVMEQNNCPIKTLYTVGGGAKNHLWTQMISDATGYPQVINAVTMGAAYGDAFLAGICSGAIEHQRAISTWTKQERVIEPQLDVKPIYDRIYGVFKKLYQSLYDLMQVD